MHTHTHTDTILAAGFSGASCGISLSHALPLTYAHTHTHTRTDTMLAAGFSDASCVIWETRMGKQVQALHHHQHQVGGMSHVSHA